MGTLQDFGNIKSKIDIDSIKNLKLLHNVITGDPSLRLNRARLRSFEGFYYEGDIYEQKLDNIKLLTNPNLIVVCNILNLSYDGTHDELAERILRFLNDLEVTEVENDEEEEDPEAIANDDDGGLVHANNDGIPNNDGNNSVAVQDAQDDENDGAIDVIQGGDQYQKFMGGQQPQTTNNFGANFKAVERFSLTFRDVEDSIRRFNGKDDYPVGKWIQEFDEFAVLMGWNEIQTLVFAKKSLDGVAKLLVNAERGVTTWAQLKRVLRNEFETTIDSSQVHKMLMKRRKRNDESLQEYVLVMREIAGRANVEESALIRYIIDGIPDHPNNKAVLYGVHNIQEFKVKLKIYESIKSSIETKPSFNKDKNESKKYDKQVDSNKMTCCYNCGQKGHQSRNCPTQTKGPKCFTCNNYGHKSPNCPMKKERNPAKVEMTKEVGSVKNIKKSKSNVCDIVINHEYRFDALLDTGSEVNLMRLDDFLNLGINKLNGISISLYGIGKQCLSTLGSFIANVTVDQCTTVTKVHVVPNNVINISVIIGQDYLNGAKIIIDDKIRVYPKTLEATKIIGDADIREKGTVDNRLEMTNSDKTLTDHLGKTDDEFREILQVSYDELNIPNENFRDQITELIENYTPARNPKSTGITMKIILTDDEPVYQRARRLPVSDVREVEKIVNDWKEKGIIQPSFSDYSSPIVPVKKKDGSMRICVDYRQLNRKTVKDRYPLPIIEDQLDKLRNAKVFTTLDLKNGFHHVNVDKDSIKYTSFVTSFGQYEFLKMPFGLSNAPALFQRYVNIVFKNLIRVGIVLTYMDDLIIPAANYDEAFQKIQVVFQQASEYGLEFNWKKCYFLTKEIEYLGYRISNNSIQPSLNKIKAVQKFPKPTTAKAIQSFLGLTGAFRKFIPDYAKIARPLSNLLKKNNTFTFGNEEEIAFKTLKDHLSKELILKIYSPDLYTELHTDASQIGFGAVLFQRDPDDQQLHPIYYMSHKTSEVEQRYHSYELEVLAVIRALEKFRVYLIGIDFKIVTDCAAFKMTMAKKEVSAKIWRWASYLEDFKYTIEHRSGTRMKHCDALSRHPVMLIESTFLNRLRQCQRDDEHLRAILSTLEQNHTYEDYLTNKGLLYKQYNERELLVIPRSMQNEIIKRTHEGNGHFGVKKVVDVIQQEFWFSKMKVKVANCIKNCIPCILIERKSGKAEGLLHPISKDETPLSTYHIDHVGPLVATTKGYKYIFAVIDGFTKFVWLYPTKTVSTEEAIEKLEQQKAIFGNPKRMISDRGTAFTSHQFTNYCQDEGIDLYHITTGVPQGNGQIERIFRIILPSLAKLCIDEDTKWFRQIPRLQRVLNKTYQRSIDTTPFELLFGVRAQQPEDIELKSIIEAEYREMFQDNREEIREQAKEQILKVQEENRKGFNKKRKDANTYNIGDLVAIKRTQFINMSKLKSKYLGPYRITKVKRNDRYNVEKVGVGEGPRCTSTSANFMKPWYIQNDNDSDEFEDESNQEGRDVGISKNSARKTNTDEDVRSKREKKKGLREKKGLTD